MCVDSVSLGKVARSTSENSISLPSQQHRRQRSRAARAHDNCIKCLGHSSSRTLGSGRYRAELLQQAELDPYATQHSTVLPSMMRSMSVPRYSNFPSGGRDALELARMCTAGVQRVTTISPSAI